jgi:hypothetical protein
MITKICFIDKNEKPFNTSEFHSLKPTKNAEKIKKWVGKLHSANKKI